MSETVEKPNVEIGGGETPTMEDVHRTLRELRGEKEKLERDLRTERSHRANLETNLDGERTARTVAEQERDQNAGRVITEAEARWNAEKQATEAAIVARQQALAAARDDYARHAELGEWTQAADAQVAIAEAAAELKAQRDRVTYLEVNKERIIPKAQPRAEVPQRQAEPTHRYSRFVKGALLGGEEAFLDARPQFQTDEAYREQLFSASNIAARKFERGSEPYLREVERILGEDGGDRNRYQDDPPARQERRDRSDDRQSSQSADLPASRRAGPGHHPSGSQAEIRLTPEEAEVADAIYGNVNDDMYIPNQKDRYIRYHENKIKMAARG